MTCDMPAIMLNDSAGCGTRPVSAWADFMCGHAGDPAGANHRRVGCACQCRHALNLRPGPFAASCFTILVI